jgi:L-lactate utilization protein LutB
MDKFVEEHRKIRVNATVDSLKKNGFDAHFFENRQEAVKFIMDAAADYDSVSIAGTHTVRALGVVQLLESAGKTLFDHWQYKPGTAEELACRKKQMTADLFLSSVNAITMTGEIVNREGCGNRINSMTFGPKKVILVVGINKVVSDLDSAFSRIDEIAAPIRAMSLGRKTPCTKTGYCMDCDSPERICRITSIIHRKPMLTDISVIILDEDLGY